jgi:hypothetical protein
MGGNIKRSSGCPVSPGGLCGTLLGPEGAAREGCCFNVPGSGPSRIPVAVLVALVGLVGVWGSVGCL